MLMVIFGAGASYDSFARAPASVHDYNRDRVRLPLANQLFDQRFGPYYQIFPQCHAVIPDLQQSGVNVESVLEQLQQATSQYPQGLVQLAAVRYYLGYMLWRCQTDWTNSVTHGVTNYKNLLDKIARRPIAKEKVCLVTFNYDTLLDDALTSRGINLKSMSDYVTSDFYLIKLHGSIDWVHEVRDFQTQSLNARELITEMINQAPTLDVIGESFERVSADPFNRQPGRTLFPALAIPVENKPGYECPQEQLKALEKCLPKVTKVLIVGWRASENKFLKTLAEGIPKSTDIMVVSRDEGSASQTVNRINPFMRDAKVTGNMFAAKTSFSNFVLSPELNQFIPPDS